MLERCVGRMEGQRNIGLEAVGFVLKIAQPQQVVSAIFFVLDVAIEHRGVGF